MQPHGKPKVNYKVKVSKEISALNDHKKKRNIPSPSDSKVLIATWNLTNFGVQKRTPEHLELMAKIISYFDLVAIQEVADDLTHLNTIRKHLTDKWDVIFSDTSGNNERLGYFYNSQKIEPVGLVAELAMAGYQKRKMVIRLADEEKEVEFTDFNRNPYMVNFKAGDFIFTTVNVHLYWSNTQLREAEADVLAKWAKKRSKEKFPPNDDIILIGDFNIPKVEDNDKIYSHLKKYGMKAAKYSTNIFGSDLAGKFDYDELIFFPSTGSKNVNVGVFDFDKAVFADLWHDTDKKKQQLFFDYIRYYMADHRPLWCEFKIK